MQKTQKTYTAELKREAVRLAETSGKPITHIAREWGISDTSIHLWRKELAEHGVEAFPGSGQQTALEEENRRQSNSEAFHARLPDPFGLRASDVFS